MASDTRRLRVVVDGDERGGTEALNNLNKSVRESDSRLGKFGDSAKRFGGLAAIALSTAGTAAGGLGLKTASGLEQAQVAFTNMLGSGEKAQTFLKQLQQFANATPFEFPDLVIASQRLLAMGFDSKQLIPTLTAVGDAVAAMGGGKDQVQAVVTALGQMQAKGRISGEEIMQMTEQGIPALQILADKFGVSTGEMQKMITKGTVPAAKGIAALTDGLEHGTKNVQSFGGMMNQQSKTMAGRWSSLMDSVQTGLGNLVLKAAPLIDTFLEKATTGFTNTFNYISSTVIPGVKNAIYDLSEGFRVGFSANPEDAMSRFGVTLQRVGATIKVTVQFITGTLIPALQTMYQWVANNIVPLFIKWVGLVKDNLTPVWHALVDVFTKSVMPAIMRLVAVFEQNKKQIMTVVAVIGIIIAAFVVLTGKIASFVIPILIKLVGNALALVINTITNVIKILDFFGEGFITLAHAVSIAYTAVVNFGSNAISAVKSAFSAVAGVVHAAGTAIMQLPGRIAALPGQLGALAMTAIKFFLNSLVEGAKAVLSFVEHLPGRILDGMANLIVLLLTLGKNGAIAFAKAIRDGFNATVSWVRSVPGTIWNALKALPGLLKNAAITAWTAYSNFTHNLVMAVVTWLTGLPGRILNAIRALGGIIRNIAVTAWTNFKNTTMALALSLVTWATSIPGRIRSSIASLGSVIGKIASDAWNGFKTRTQTIARSAIDWAKGVPGAMGKALGSVGSVVANSLKGAWNGAADWLNRHAIGNINKITGVFGAPKIPNLPRFARGGVIPGPVSAVDNQLIMARTGEGILVPEAVKALGGASGIDQLNRMFRGKGRPVSSRGTGDPAHGESDLLQHFADGGVIGKISGGAKAVGSWFKRNVQDKVTDWVAQGAGFALDKLLSGVGTGLRGVMPDGFLENFLVGHLNRLRSYARAWGDKKEQAQGFLDGGGFVPGSGHWPPRRLGVVSANTAAAVNFIRRTWGINNIGTLGSRPNVSDHPWGKALDAMIGNWQSPAGIGLGNTIAQWFTRWPNVFGTKYVIWRARINSGRGWAPYTHPTGATDPTSMHMDHVHVSLFDKGGTLKPGFNTVYNGTGSNEHLVPSGSGNIILNVNVTVQGNVTAENDLAESITKAVREQLNRIAGRNGGRLGLK